jgi:hypothetical protein
VELRGEYDESPNRLFFLGGSVVTALTAESRSRLFLLLLLLLFDDREDEEEVVTRDGDLGLGLGVVLRILVDFVVVASVVTRFVGAFRMNEGRVGLTRVVCFGERSRPGFCLLDLENKLANRGSVKLLFLIVSGLAVDETESSAFMRSLLPPGSDLSFSEIFGSDAISSVDWFAVHDIIRVTMKRQR